MGKVHPGHHVSSVERDPVLNEPSGEFGGIKN